MAHKHCQSCRTTQNVITDLTYSGQSLMLFFSDACQAELPGYNFYFVNSNFTYESKLDVDSRLLVSMRDGIIGKVVKRKLILAQSVWFPVLPFSSGSGGSRSWSFFAKRSDVGQRGDPRKGPQTWRHRRPLWTHVEPTKRHPITRTLLQPWLLTFSILWTIFLSKECQKNCSYDI